LFGMHAFPFVPFSHSFCPSLLFSAICAMQFRRP
jgi:hypothetical protein